MESSWNQTTATAASSPRMGGHISSSGSLSSPVSTVPQATVHLGQTPESVGIAEEEAILQSFNEHLAAFLSAVVASTSTDALAALISPLCTVIPRILTHCTMFMVAEYARADAQSEDEGDYFDPLVGAEHHLKTHLLRMVVSVQQSTAMQIQGFSIQLETKRRLLDMLTEGFEKARRFITMLGISAVELKSYLKSNPTEYSKEETEILWIKAADR